MPDKALSVSAANQLIASSLDAIGRIQIQGEIGSLTIARSGHAYITLRDHDAALNVTMWRSTVVRNSPFPKEGDQVIVSGRLENYAPRGSISLIATTIKKAGAGDLAQQLAALQARLTSEGLFDEDRKKELPALPHAIGIATASGSAAQADMLTGIVDRFPYMPIVFQDCRVQGAGSAQTIVAAIQKLDEHPDVDVIIVGRGGGSLEDLWSFNEEPVIRAIAACQTPIISAIGHETDHSLSDLAADVCAKTPTMAAELATPAWHDLLEEITWRRNQLARGMSRHLQNKHAALAHRRHHRALSNPQGLLTRTQEKIQRAAQQHTAIMQRKIDQQKKNLHHAAGTLRRSLPTTSSQRQALMNQAKMLNQSALQHMKEKAQDLQKAGQLLHAFSPLSTFQRGWSVAYNQANQAIKAPDDIAQGEVMKTRLSTGWVESTVTKQIADPTSQKSTSRSGGPKVEEPLIRYTPEAPQGSQEE